MLTDLFLVNGKLNKTEFIMTILPPVLLGILSVLLVNNHMGAYKAASYAAILPPPYLLAAVWLITLALAGAASYRVKRAAPEASSQLNYAATLLCAFIWNAVLFRFGEEKTAIIVFVVYFFFLIATFFEFDKADKIAGRLMLPSVAWAVLMAYVNYALLG